MPLSALSQTYHTRRNIPYNDNSTQLGMMRSCVWNLKAALTNEITTGTTGANARGAGTSWTHIASCDSTTTSTGTDLWGTTYTAAALVWNSHGNAHSWWHGRNTNLGYDIVIALAHTQDTAILIAAVPTSQGFTGGTTTSRPVNSTYEINAGYTTQGTGNWFTWQADVTTGNTNFFNFTVGADGSFYFMTTRQTLGFPSSFFAIQKPHNTSYWPAPADANNVQFMLLSPTTSSPGVLGISNLTAAGSCIGLLPSNTRPTSGGIGQLYFNNASIGNQSIVTDYTLLEHPCIPLPILQWTATVSAVRGTLRDWWMHPNRSLIPSGTTNDPSAVVSHVAFGDYFLPWNGSAPTL